MNTFSLLRSVLIVIVFVPQVSHAFEKYIMWSGRHAATAGTAASYTEGAEALYFNPAGLVTERLGQTAEADLSLVLSRFSGPIADNTPIESKTLLSTPFALMYARTPTEKFGYGVGIYASGGSAVQYDAVSVNAAFPTLKPELLFDLKIIEFAAGAAYKIADDFKLGVAWRVGWASANFKTAYVKGTDLIALNLQDMKALNAGGVKLGLQYAPSQSWGLGLVYRSEFKFDTKGQGSGKTESALAPGTVNNLSGGETTAVAILPSQVTFGGHWSPEAWRLSADYTWTQYSRDSSVPIQGSLSGSVNEPDIPDVVLNWRDQNVFRFGAEYSGYQLPIRFGYQLASQAVPGEFAAPTFTAPGLGHTFTTGTAFALITEGLVCNLAAEYTIVKGRVDQTANPPQSTSAIGDYKTQALALHSGFTYAF